jgi:aerobic-type carbon monoxide dehydrogenase small subunit (CoxS/CutS family)
MQTRVRLAVNGQAVDRAVDVRRSLSDFLREDLGLTGTHVGCEHGVCGTPGMVVVAHELLARTAAPGVEEIREALAGNLCMCTGYVNIVRAVARAATGPAE